jgi:carboxyl-terminal processing protease
MKPRGIITIAVLSCAIVSGGWLVQRGLVYGRTSSATASAPIDGARLYQQVLERVEQAYVDTNAIQNIYRKTVDGLLLELGDPHTSYLTDDRLNKLNETTTGQYAGVGIEMDLRDGWITVVRPLPGSPAEAAGIRTADKVVEINGKSTHRWTREEAAKAMRGVPGTTVKIGVERIGTTGTIPFTLTRRNVHLSSVPHALTLRNGVGYVDLVTFSDSAARELRSRIDSLRRSGVSKLILDLRGDPGGLLEQGVGVSELFLDPKESIVSMRGRTADVTRTYADSQPQPWPDLVLAVLVDSNSASASEIVAGALQDHDRAVLIGSPTYGKGSAQTVFPVDGGALKLTIAKWFTPSGRSIDKKRSIEATDSVAAAKLSYRTDDGRRMNGGGGIRPDIIVNDSAYAALGMQLSRAVGLKANDFRDVLTTYALSLKASGAIRQSGFVVTPEMRSEVLRRLAARGVVIDSATARATTPVIDRLLAPQIERYVFGTDAEFRRILADDKTVQKAIDVLGAAKDQKDAISKAR